MHKPTLLLFALLLHLASAGQQVYVSASGDARIEIYDFDGKLTLRESVTLKGGPGNSVISPDGKYLYVAVTAGKGKDRSPGIETLAFQPGGGLKSVGFAKTPYRCGFLDTDGKGTTLFSSHYGEGRVTSYKLEDGIYRGTVIDDIVTAEKAHCVRIDRTDAFVYVPHTAPNKMFQFTFTDGKLQALAPPAADGPDTENRYHEPRHFVFHPQKDFVYTANERGGGLSHWTYNKAGQLTLKQTVCTLPENANEKFAASDITITSDGRFVYVANRDNLERNNPVGGDCIAAYALNSKTGAIEKKIGSYTVGRHPRCLRIDTSGQFLFGPGVNSSDLTVYGIDAQSGALKPVQTIDTGKGPRWVVCRNQN